MGPRAAGVGAALALAAPGALAEDAEPTPPATSAAPEHGDPVPENEPWSDRDPAFEPLRHSLGPSYGIALEGEYRANWLYVNPIALSSVNQRRASWVEHRLRVDTRLDYRKKVRVILSLDALDGVMWGDNGTFAREPLPNSGSRVAASTPNSVRPVIGFKRGSDPTDPDNYGYVLEEVDALEIRRAYGEVETPVGLLRIGRQPTTQGTGLLVADGDGRKNRFGYAGSGDSSDRVLFATKPLEGAKPPHLRNRSRNEGFFLVLFYDRVVTNRAELFGDDLHMAGSSLRLLDPEWAAGEDLNVSLSFVHRWERDFKTVVNSGGVRAISRFGDLFVGGEAAVILGATREISEALSRIKGEAPERQKIRQFGARGVARYDRPAWSAYLELDYASGDDNPETGSNLTQFTFAEDANVGLLMFERILQFESARSAAAGVELLRTLDADSFPAEKVDTEGSFTNAVAIFPQVDVRPHRNVLLRGGVLTAWAPRALTDSVMSLRSKDGDTVADDVINYHGGKPGNFYGVELDGRFQWRYLEHFLFDLEGAVLFPGNAFYNQNEQAARSVLVQGRSTFLF